MSLLVELADCQTLRQPFLKYRSYIHLEYAKPEGNRHFVLVSHFLSPIFSQTFWRNIQSFLESLVCTNFVCRVLPLRLPWLVEWLDTRPSHFSRYIHWTKWPWMWLRVLCHCKFLLINHNPLIVSQWPTSVYLMEDNLGKTAFKKLLERL